MIEFTHNPATKIHSMKVTDDSRNTLIAIKYPNSSVEVDVIGTISLSEEAIRELTAFLDPQKP